MAGALRFAWAIKGKEKRASITSVRTSHSANKRYKWTALQTEANSLWKPILKSRSDWNAIKVALQTTQALSGTQKSDLDFILSSCMGFVKSL